MIFWIFDDFGFELAKRAKSQIISDGREIYLPSGLVTDAKEDPDEYQKICSLE